MSVKLMAHVWELELEHGKQSVLLALADHANDDGTKCFPGVDYIAWKTAYSDRQVQRILRDLETDGLIRPVAHEKGGRGNATEYQLYLEKGVRKSPFVSKYSRERVTSETAKGDICDIKGDIAMSPQPSVTIIEPAAGARAEDGDPLQHPAVLAYNKALKPDRALSINQCEVIAATVTDMVVWAEVLRIFQGNDYRARYAGNAVDRYLRLVEKKNAEAPPAKTPVATFDRINACPNCDANGIRTVWREGTRFTMKCKHEGLEDGNSQRPNVGKTAA